MVQKMLKARAVVLTSLKRWNGGNLVIGLQYLDLYFGFRCDPEAAYLHSS